MLKFMLAPVLIVQGKQVRKNTPRLSEAGGPRKGIHGNGSRKIRLLILGDSAAAGVGVNHQSSALSGQILACFGKEYQVEWELNAKSGRTTAMTLEHLETRPPAVFDVVVTSLGVNDVKASVEKGLWLEHQKKMVHVLRKKFNAQRVILSAVPPMELFPAIPWPLKWYLGLCSRSLNRSLKSWVNKQPDCEVLDFNLPLDRRLMAEDGFHPGPALHTIWGRELSERIKLHVEGPC